MPSKESRRMQTTSGDISASSSAACNVAVPVAQIEGEIAEAPGAARAHRARCRASGPGKVPLKMVAQQYGPQVRSEVISDAVQTTLQRRGARAEPARRRLSAHRAAPATRAARRDALEFSAMFEVYPEIVRSATSRRSHDRAAAGRGRPPPTSTARSRCCASSARRSSRVDARRADRRPRAWSISPA